MSEQFWYTLPLYVIAFICFYLLGLYIALNVPWVRERDYHLVAFSTFFALVGTLLFSYII